MSKSNFIEAFKTNSNFRKKIICNANDYAKFRSRCKDFLRTYNKEYDKFTSTNHDSQLGYISELAIMNYLTNNTDYEIIPWDANFDFNFIESILQRDQDTINQKELDYVKKYFYDDYDLKIIKNNQEIFIDVKTAITFKKPTNYWEFSLPVVQINKAVYDYVILCYCIAENEIRVDNINDIIIWGFISTNDVQNKDVYPKGAKNRFGTINQIDNYNTKLSDYNNSILEMF